MLISAFETALLIIMWCYIYEFKMRTAERISRLHDQLAETVYFNKTRQVPSIEDYGSAAYSRRIESLLDIALRQS
jgi:outer membrane protein assembly factor BamE (lipoprotein component of BamABCDE complex)